MLISGHRIKRCLPPLIILLNIMWINVEKSKTVVMSRGEKEGKGVIKVGDKELEVVKDLKYLGSELTEDGRLGLEISRRIQLGSAFYQQYGTRIYQ